MDKKAALDTLMQRCFAARVPLYQVCARAKVAQSTTTRWKADPETMTVAPLSRLERALDAIEAERASPTQPESAVA